MTNKQIDSKKSESLTLKDTSPEFQAWYADEFLPFKNKKEQDKADFNAFAKIIINNTNEVKFLLSCVYDNKFEQAVKAWNELKLNPEIKDMKLVDENLIIINLKNEEMIINFEELLNNISKVLEG